MLGLPKSTELNKPLPKTAIYAKFQMNGAEKAKIDADISRIVIVNEVSAGKLNLAPGEKVQTFFVLDVVLKRKDYNEKTVVTLSKLIVLVLEHDGLAKLAVYHTRLLQTQWLKLSELSLDIKGITMDTVWENVIIQIGGIHMQNGNTLEQQIAQDEQRKKLEKEIARLEKLAWAEKQPKKKFELAEKIDSFKVEIQSFVEGKVT